MGLLEEENLWQELGIPSHRRVEVEGYGIQLADWKHITGLRRPVHMAKDTRDIPRENPKRSGPCRESAGWPETAFMDV